MHVHEARAYLGVMLAGPRVAALPPDLPVPDRVSDVRQSLRPTPARVHQRDRRSSRPRDDWPFLYLRDRHLPRHYLAALALILVVSGRRRSCCDGRAAAPGGWSWQFFLLGAGFMLLETKSITQFALLWGSTWVVASLAIAVGAGHGAGRQFRGVARRKITRPWLVGAVLIALLALNYAVPVGALAFESRAVESLVYAVLMFSPILCAGLLFGSAIKRSTSVARDYGANLLGAMVGGVGEYLSLDHRLPGAADRHRAVLRGRVAGGDSRLRRS